MNYVRGFVAVAIFVCGGSFFGCAPDYGGRQEVKGTVKLKGEPLSQAVIDFTPLESQPTKMGALITNGTYEIPRASGLMPGKYKVIITAGDGRTPENSDQPPGPSGANIVSKERVPPEYNTQTKQEVEVKAKGSNVFDYDIP